MKKVKMKKAVTYATKANPSKGKIARPSKRTSAKISTSK